MSVGTITCEETGDFLPDRRFLLGTALAFCLFYLPFFFGPQYTHITIYDNLDIEAAHNTVVGIFFLHPTEAKHLLLGGHLPIYFMQKLDWPLSLVHLIPNLFIAYLLCDLIVRMVAFFGMFCLSRKLEVAQPAAFAASILFSFSLAESSIGLSIAAIPAVVYFCQKAADGSIQKRDYLFLLLLGWNSSLVFAGVFVLIALPLLRRILFGAALCSWFFAYICYGLGLTLGSAGLLYGLVAGPPLHRESWMLSGDTFAASIRTFLRNQISPGHWDFYHVSTPLVPLYISVLVALAITRKRKLLWLVTTIVFVNLFYIFVNFEPVARFRTHVGGLFKTFVFERFFFLDSFLIIIAWVIAMSVDKTGLRRLLIGAMVLQMVVTCALTPHLRAPIMHALGKPTIPSFEEHTMPGDYRIIRNAVGENPTMSVGLDPMAAVMNRISAIDGYYNAYPLAYKRAFRPIIARQIESGHPYINNWGSELHVINTQGYFDNWGSRLYTFVDNPAYVDLDYCPAFRLGALFVISQFDLKSDNLDLLLTTEPHHLRLYSIRKCT
jgi:hypothetical protein